jgi:hypothetical protein
MTQPADPEYGDCPAYGSLDAAGEFDTRRPRVKSPPSPHTFIVSAVPPRIAGRRPRHIPHYQPPAIQRVNSTPAIFSSSVAMYVETRFSPFPLSIFYYIILFLFFIYPTEEKENRIKYSTLYQSISIYPMLFHVASYFSDPAQSVISGIISKKMGSARVPPICYYLLIFT